MKITNDTQIGNGSKNNRVLNTGAKAVGYAFGGKAGAQAASKVVNSKPVQAAANALITAKKKETSDVGQNKIKNSLANRGRNSFFSFKKRKKVENNNDNNSVSDEDNTSNDEQTSLDSMSNFIRRYKRIKISLIIGSALLPVMLILMLLSAAVATISRNEISFSSINFNKSDSSEWSEEERKYYGKIEELSQFYLKEYHDIMAANYIHAALIYYYYVVDENENINIGKELVDFNHMYEMIDTINNLIPKSFNNNYSINGEFYNNLKNSAEFQEYYRPLLNYGETIDEILEDIFELGNSVDIENDTTDETYISEKTIVNVNKDGKKVNITYNTSPTNNQNKSTNNDGAITFKEYLAGTVYASINPSDLSNNGMVQSLVIANTTNLLNKSNMSLGEQVISVNTKINYCSVASGCSYNSQGELVSGPGEKNNSNTINYGGKYYYRPPLTSSAINNLDSNVNAVYGNVLTNNSTSTNLDTDKILRISGTSYQDILSRAYPNYRLDNISEDNYANNLDYGPRKVQTSVIFYDQKDYSNNMFCHRTGSLKNNNIGSSGCGVVAMSIVASTYKNSQTYSPLYMNEEAYSLNGCGGSDGTYFGFFASEIKRLGYKYMKISGKPRKDSEKNLILKHLSQGHLAIIHVGPGDFTGSGHYMVLSGVDPATKKVYVTDPNNRSNKSYRKTGSGWYSYNSIVKQIKNGVYIVWKG